MQYIINDKHIRAKNEHYLTCPVPSDTYMYREEVILGSLTEMFHQCVALAFLYALLDLFYFLKNNLKVSYSTEGHCYNNYHVSLN